VERLANGLADAAISHDPLFDPKQWLADVRVPVLLSHGRHDSLIPFSECSHLDRGLGPRSRGVTITDLYAHSGAGPMRNVLHAASAWTRMAALMGKLVRLDR